MRDREQRQQKIMGVERAREAAALEVPGLLSAIVEGTPDAVFVKDLDGRYLLVNSACTRILGRPKEEIVGRDDAQILPPEAAARLAEVDRLVMDTGEASSYEEVLPAGGRSRTFLSTKSVHRDATGNALGIIGISRDITERKLAEEERARLAAIVRSSEDAIFGKTLEGTITSWNPGAQKIYGYSSKEAVGSPVSMLVPPEVSDEVPAILEKVRSGEVVAHETVRLTKDGRRIDVSLTVSPIRGSEDEVVGASTIARDVTERKRAEEAAFEVREAERSRLARDLHDGPLQDLSVVVQELEARRVASKMDGPDSGLGREIDALRRAVRGLREAVYDLRPPNEASLLERLEQMVRHYRDLTPEREIALVVGEGFPPRLPEEVATQLLRLVREALSNARQHSAARHVRVSLGATGEDVLSVEVADDGRGFVAETVDEGMGLSTMRERAALLGGDLEVSSEPGGGTRVRLRLVRPNDAP